MRENDTGTEGARRPYGRPALKTYGGMAAVTRTEGGNAGKNDMGGGNDKTGFT